MSRKKLCCILVMSLIIIINIFISLNISALNSDYDLRKLSIWGVFCFLVEVFTWRKLTGKLLSPYFLFFCVGTVYCTGQMFGWAFNLDLDHYDLTTYLPHISTEILYKGLLFSVLGLAFFHLGAMMSYRELYYIPDYYNEEKNEYYLDSIQSAARFLFCISLPSALYLNIIKLTISMYSGYGAIYDMSSSLTKFQRLLIYPAEWFPICLMVLYVCACQESQRNDIRKRVYLLLIFAYLSVSIIAGGRSAGVMFVISFIIAQHYLVAPFRMKNMIFLGGFGYVGLTILSTISKTRTVANRSFEYIISTFFEMLPKAVGSIVGELGWTMSSVCWTMELIPSQDIFRKGLSYLFAFTAIIPNLGFWSVHPATIYSNLGDWLQNAKGISFGIGYSFVAEAYANFGWGGTAALLVFGVIIGRLLNKVDSDTAILNYRSSFFVIILIEVLTASFIRASFSSIMRSLVFTVGGFYLVVHIVQSRNRSRK